MSDFNCPYCKKEGEIDYDDGDFFKDSDEGIKYECGWCDKTYLVNVSISFYYEGVCTEEGHEWGPYKRFGSSESEKMKAHNKSMEEHLWCEHCDAIGPDNPSKS